MWMWWGCCSFLSFPTSGVVRKFPDVFPILVGIFLYQFKWNTILVVGNKQHSISSNFESQFSAAPESNKQNTDKKFKNTSKSFDNTSSEKAYSLWTCIELSPAPTDPSGPAAGGAVEDDELVHQTLRLRLRRVQVRVGTHHQVWNHRDWVNWEGRGRLDRMPTGR